MRAADPKEEFAMLHIRRMPDPDPEPQPTPMPPQPQPVPDPEEPEPIRAAR